MDGEAVQGVAYKSSDGETRVVKANLTIVCDGMYSNLRSVILSSTSQGQCALNLSPNFRQRKRHGRKLVDSSFAGCHAGVQDRG